MTLYPRNRSALSFALVLFCIVAPVTVPCSVAEEPLMLEEVIVRAQKREQPLQDVPIAVTVFSGKSIQQSGIKDVFDLQVTAPGLVVDANQSATTSNFSIRGVGTSSQNFGLESSVGVYVDGVYRARQSAMINDLIDVDWIEILRGPQGTLFGRNTPAGAILLNTIKPDHRDSGFVDVSLGNYGLSNVSAASSLSAIADVLAFRATVFSSQRDGWIDEISRDKDNIINDRDRFGVRVQALFTPNEDLEIRVIADYAEIDETCCGTMVVYDNNERDLRRAADSPYPLGTDSILEARGGTFIDGSRTFDKVMAVNAIPVSQNEDTGLSVQVDWTLDSFTLTSVSAFRRFDSFDEIDSDFTDLDGLLVSNDAEQESFSQEFRAAGLTQRFSYVVGLYYFTQDLDSEQSLDTGADVSAIASINQEAFIADFLFPADGFATTINEQDHESWAIFGQADVPLADRLYLTAGIRYTEENKKLNAYYRETNAGLGYYGYAALAPRADISSATPGLPIDDEEVTGTLRLTWNTTTDLLLYMSYSTGYKSGGTNTDRIPENFDSVFEPETSKSFEIGMKSDFPNQAMRLNIALHKTDFDDLQVNTFNGTGFNLRNAATAETSGVEVELFWQASQTLSITAIYARVNADFGDFEFGNCWIASAFRGQSDPGGDGTLTADYCERGGDRIGTNPEDFVALIARKEYAFSSFLGFIQGEYTYNGDQIMDSSNDPLEFQDSYELINLRLGLELTNYQTEITLWGRNVTDEEYYGTAFDPPLQDGKLNAYARDPATYGISVRKSF